MLSLRQQILLVNQMWKELNNLKHVRKGTLKFIEQDMVRESRKMNKNESELLDRMNHQIIRLEVKLRAMFKDELKSNKDD